MKVMTQKLKNGIMQIIEAPLPSLQQGALLVKNHYSLISPGTEGSTVRAARQSLIGKARSRPKQMRQILETLKAQGPIQTYRAVMKRLDAWSPLGYSSVGTVVDLAPDVKEFAVGDLVTCAGAGYANHAEVVAVPTNLCVKLMPDADVRQAAYNTLGAVALQGVRQADLRLGETCAVIGLGLVGQLTCLLLRASGIRVIGIDIDPAMVDIARKQCADVTFMRDCEGIEGRIFGFTDGIGCDAVIITAASESLDPINFAGVVARKKGTVVIVGAVPTGFDREPNYYRKELQVRMSCSYGPGRYDPSYEEKGIDYPPAYVRWTEKRNMEAFQKLIYSKQIDVNYLTTHTFALENAPRAYDMLLAKEEPFIGILIEYDISKDFSKAPSKISLKPPLQGPVSLGFVGAGSYAQSYLLPNIPKGSDFVLKGVMTSTGTGSRSVAERFGFEFCASNESEILENSGINTVFVATRHDTHARYVSNALKASKHVFVEKPLCLSERELMEIAELYWSLNAQQPQVPILMVGYNRRFSPLSTQMKSILGAGPMAVTYRINAGAIAADSWIQDPEVGGGRIVGEACHFIDFITFLTGALPVSINMVGMTKAGNLNDTMILTLSYSDGSVGNICYFSNGDKSLPKEYVEAYSHGVAVVLNDFRTLSVYASGKKREKKLLTQDKGQKNEVREFLRAVKEGRQSPIPFKELYSSSLATFRAIESHRTGNTIKL